MEFIENYPVSLHLSDLKLIEEDSSKYYQKIQLFIHKELGKVFILDGEIQHIEVWAPLYHETIVHLPFSFIQKVESVLILGGGCFFTAKEVLKYDSVKEVIMIDHDLKVIELMSRNYDHVIEIIKDKRFKLEIDDAFKSLKGLNKKFDLIINDSVDLINYHNPWGTNIFNTLSTYSNSNGVCCDLVYRHIFEKHTTQRTIKKLQENDLNSAFSLVCVPEYPGILHLLIIWGRNKKIQQNMKSSLNEIQKNWIEHPVQNPCEYFSPAFLNYYFYLPPYIKRVTNESNNL